MSVYTPIAWTSPRGKPSSRSTGAISNLGKHGSETSQSEYDRLIAEWLANGRRQAGSLDLTVIELMVGAIKFVDGSYPKNGEPTSKRIHDPASQESSRPGPIRDEAFRLDRAAHVKIRRSQDGMDKRQAEVKQMAPWAERPGLRRTHGRPQRIGHGARNVPHASRAQAGGRRTWGSPRP